VYLFAVYTEGDVWSYGIAVMELVTRGKQPYNDKNEDEILELMCNDELELAMLEPPKTCPTSVYELMKLCWNSEPKHRPSFLELYEKLNKFHKSLPKSKKEEPIQKKQTNKKKKKAVYTDFL